MLISGQLGAELWTAEVAYMLREEYPELKVAVITPFYDQEKKWKEPNQELYEAVLAQADYEASLTHRPYESPLQFKQKINFLYRNLMRLCCCMIPRRKALQNICWMQQKNGVKKMDILSISLQWMI